jgi:hypothetical protein
VVHPGQRCTPLDDRDDAPSILIVPDVRAVISRGHIALGRNSRTDTIEPRWLARPPDQETSDRRQATVHGLRGESDGLDDAE